MSPRGSGRPAGDGGLRRLDDAWVPAAAARLQEWVRQAAAAVRRHLGADSPVGLAARHEPAIAGSIAAVMVAGLLVGIFGPHEPHDHDAGPVAPTGVVVPPQQTLGPRPGTAVVDYLRDASFDLRHFGEVSRGRPGYALVDLRDYLTPAQAAAVIGDLPAVRAYVRVPSDLATSVYPVSLRRTLPDLLTGMESQSRFAGQYAKTYAQIVAGFTAHTAREKQQKRIYQALATAASYESTQLARPATCTCVFALLVRATFPELTRLTGVPAVRVVDPATPTIPIDQLAVVPLRPDVTGVVPKPGILGAG